MLINVEYIIDMWFLFISLSPKYAQRLPRFHPIVTAFVFCVVLCCLRAKNLSHRPCIILKYYNKNIIIYDHVIIIVIVINVTQKGRESYLDQLNMNLVATSGNWSQLTYYNNTAEFMLYISVLYLDIIYIAECITILRTILQ